jgi:hypothetical protein
VTVAIARRLAVVEGSRVHVSAKNVLVHADEEGKKREEEET